MDSSQTFPRLSTGSGTSSPGWPHVTRGAFRGHAIGTWQIHLQQTDHQLAERAVQPASDRADAWLIAGSRFRSPSKRQRRSFTFSRERSPISVPQLGWPSWDERPESAAHCGCRSFTYLRHPWTVSHQRSLAFRWWSGSQERPQVRGNRIAAGKSPFSWSGRRDSNPRPPPWQGGALPTEPRPRVLIHPRSPFRDLQPLSWGGDDEAFIPCRSSRTHLRPGRSRADRRPMSVQPTGSR